MFDLEIKFIDGTIFVYKYKDWTKVSKENDYLYLKKEDSTILVAPFDSIMYYRLIKAV